MDLRDPDVVNEKLFHQFVLRKHKMENGKKNDENKVDQIDDDETICSLEGLVDEGINARFQHSFYTYSGSLSQPRCTKNVQRVVMYETI